MCRLDIPDLLLYTYIPALVASFLLGFFILVSNRKSSVNKNLFIFIIFLCFWNISSFFGWIVTNIEMNLFWSRISILTVLSVLFFLYFTYSLLKKELSLRKKILYAIPFIPILLLTFSNYNVRMSNIQTCESQNGSLYWYVYFLSLVYAFWSVSLLIFHYKKRSDEKIKKQIKIIISSIIFIVLWFVILVEFTTISIARGYPWEDEMFIFTPVGIVIFIGMLVYAIVKYQFLNLKLLKAQALTYSVWLAIGSMYFFATSTLNILLITLTLLLAIWFGIILIRSVKQEIKQKEEVEKINKEIIERKEELQMMANMLAVANDKLRKLDRVKTEFISIASHQLRTPLTAIKGFISLLLEGAYGKIDQNQQNVLSKIYASNERLVNLVEDLLNISRIESGRMEFKFQPWKIENICLELVDIFSIRAREKNIYLEYKPPTTPLPKIMIDGNKVREVISNLLDNAIKYTSRGGVKLQTEIIDGEKRNKENKEQFIRITVSDTGIGIPADELPYLFTKFSRGRNTSRLSVSGTGLGLYVGKSLIEANGGRIWAESDGEGRGSRFIIELPVKQRKDILEKWA